MKHRAGSLNLVLPTGIGEATFLEHIDDVSLPVLQASIGRLARESQELSCIEQARERSVCETLRLQSSLPDRFMQFCSEARAEWLHK